MPNCHVKIKKDKLNFIANAYQMHEEKIKMRNRLGTFVVYFNGEMHIALKAHLRSGCASTAGNATAMSSGRWHVRE